MSPTRIIPNGRTILLALVVAGTTNACATTAAAPRSGDEAAAAPASGPTAVRSPLQLDSGLIAKARAAQRQHDWRSLREIQADLIERVGLPAITAARANYQRMLADLAVATSRGDSRARAAFRAELRALCEADGLVVAFEMCGADIVVRGT